MTTKPQSIINTAVYVNINKPISMKIFKKHTQPMGWYRIDILLRKLKDRAFRNKFTGDELKAIKIYYELDKELVSISKLRDKYFQSIK